MYAKGCVKSYTGRLFLFLLVSGFDVNETQWNNRKESCRPRIFQAIAAPFALKGKGAHAEKEAGLAVLVFDDLRVGSTAGLTKRRL